MHPRRLTVSDVFIAGLAILLQPFLCVYTVFTGRRHFLFRFARRPTIESRSPPFSTPPLFFSLPYFQQSIPPHLDSSAFLFLFPLETLDVGKRTMMPPPLQLSSRNGNFFHLFSFSFFFSLLSSSLLLSPRRKSMRHDRRPCKILERKMLLYALMRTRIELFRGEGGKKSCRSWPRNHDVWLLESRQDCPRFLVQAMDDRLDDAIFQEGAKLRPRGMLNF